MSLDGRLAVTRALLKHDPTRQLFEALRVAHKKLRRDSTSGHAITVAAAALELAERLDGGVS
jgi:hypothetical protein